LIINIQHSILPNKSKVNFNGTEGKHKIPTFNFPLFCCDNTISISGCQEELEVSHYFNVITQLHSYLNIKTDDYLIKRWAINFGHEFSRNCYYYFCWQKLRIFLYACNIPQIGFDWSIRKKEKDIQFWLPYDIQTQIIYLFLDELKYIDGGNIK
jgi:hypothetical protein